MSEILINYDKDKENYESFALALRSLLNTLIRDSGISVHSLNERVKTRKSLETKIIKKDKYEKISDITDIVGVRIITHYSDDVDKIAELVEKEFSIDIKNSIDKRTSMEPDRFGYLSLHYIASLKSNRTRLREYTSYKGKKFEIQIRSILQHAWAEIEHDIGYKSNTGLPTEIRRYFSRLAGLLELADDEFIKIRVGISTREQEVAQELASGSGQSSLDIVALNEFINKSSLIDEVSEVIFEKFGIKAQGRAENNKVETILNGLRCIKVNTIKDLNNLLSKHSELVAKRMSAFSDNFFSFYSGKSIPRDTIISYICQIEVALTNSRKLEVEYSREAQLKLTKTNATDFFKEIRTAIK